MGHPTDEPTSSLKRPLKLLYGRPENVLGTSWINFLEMSIEDQIRTSLEHHFRTSPGCQIETSLAWSNRTFKGRPGDIGGGRPGDMEDITDADYVHAKRVCKDFE